MSVTTSFVAVAVGTAIFKNAFSHRLAHRGFVHFVSFKKPCEAAAAPPTSVATVQLLADLIIALAYFSIPVELIYFYLKAPTLPVTARVLLWLFASFIVLCGMTHFIAAWTYEDHSPLLRFAATVVKATSAAVSMLTAVVVVFAAPSLLYMKIQEVFLRNTTSNLNTEVELARVEAELARILRILTEHISHSLDRDIIIDTTLTELTKALSLTECMVLMPSPGSNDLFMTHAANTKFDGVHKPLKPGVSLSDDVVQKVMVATDGPRVIAVRESAAIGDVLTGCHHRMSEKDTIVAMPLHVPVGNDLPMSSVFDNVEKTDADSACEAVLHRAQGEEELEAGPAVADSTNSGSSYGEPMDSPKGILVLLLPGERVQCWKTHGLLMIEMVADRLGVALSHAAKLELCEQNLQQLAETWHALHKTQRETKAVIDAHNDFISVMNHELRTPLHAITNVLSFLEEEVDLIPEVKTLVRAVAKSSKSLYSVADKVLDFSLLCHGMLGLHIRPFDFEELLVDVKAQVKPLGKDKHVTIGWLVGDDVSGIVVGDRLRIIQIFRHLVDNACKFAENGRVVLCVSLIKLSGLELQGEALDFQDEEEDDRKEHQQQDVLASIANAAMSGPCEDVIVEHKISGNNISRFSPWHFHRGGEATDPELQTAVQRGGPIQLSVQIRDNGVGLDPSELPHIFKKYVEVEALTDNKRSATAGIGLGLSICKRLCDMHWGGITIQSDGVGLGTTVTFSVLLGGSETGRSNSDSEKALLNRGLGRTKSECDLMHRLHGVRVLVCDDNAVNRMIAKGLVKSLGCEVDTVCSGNECVGRLQRHGHGYHLLLLDLCMPEMDGFEVALQLRDTFPSRERPLIVAFTALPERETKARCLSLGMADVITKPISRHDLGKRICALLGL
ncbi:hypothetical protein CBR_g11900 [Chara braunii]|uniref:Ethylene receptor n=1 Tax=Chara braunii TaxID=69332 RepID=A0A388KQH4_CHABU|nr:hypothetical protein CBR_g11900 [Chara braunii]|eukprot:GBG72321.1 hypothetical protein CBR_g11900 [Chara braunii]